MWRKIWYDRKSWKILENKQGTRPYLGRLLDHKTSLRPTPSVVLVLHESRHRNVAAAMAVPAIGLSHSRIGNFVAAAMRCASPGRVRAGRTPTHLSSFPVGPARLLVPACIFFCYRNIQVQCHGEEWWVHYFCLAKNSTGLFWSRPPSNAGQTGSCPGFRNWTPGGRCLRGEDRGTTLLQKIMEPGPPQRRVGVWTMEYS